MRSFLHKTFFNQIMELRRLHPTLLGPFWEYLKYRCKHLQFINIGRKWPIAWQNIDDVLVVLPTNLLRFLEPFLQRTLWVPASVWNPVSSALNILCGLGSIPKLLKTLFNCLYVFSITSSILCSCYSTISWWILSNLSSNFIFPSGLDHKAPYRF